MLEEREKTPKPNKNKQTNNPKQNKKKTQTTTTWRNIKTGKTLNKTKHQDTREERKYLHFGIEALLKY